MSLAIEMFRHMGTGHRSTETQGQALNLYKINHSYHMFCCYSSHINHLLLNILKILLEQVPEYGTGRHQDTLVGSNPLVIFTDQSHIAELLQILHVSQYFI